VKLVVVILAAGEGTRMKSSLPKVLHQICGKPMVKYVVETAKELNPRGMVAVIGYGAHQVTSHVKDDAEIVIQEQQLGTGHAVRVAESVIGDFDGMLLVLCGDTPLLKSETLRKLIDIHRESKAAATILTAVLKDPVGYGRIIRDKKGLVAGIVEEKDVTFKQQKICEINSGTYCFDAKKLFVTLPELTRENEQREFYLTDVIGILKSRGEKIATHSVSDGCEVLGVNSRRELAKAEGIMRERIINGWMEEGVTFIDPLSTFVGPDVTLGQDTLIYPFTLLEGSTSVGRNCTIGPWAHLIDAQVGDEVEIRNGVIRESIIEDGVRLGPFCSLRPGTRIKKGAKIGTFVEVKSSDIGRKSKVPHLSYIGDATIGEDVNIGAGTITCNYDGIRKYKTIIEDGAFIGSDTMLIAPVKIGKNAATGAGSAIAQDVPDDSLAVERSQQKVIRDWSKKRKKKRRKGRT